MNWKDHPEDLVSQKNLIDDGELKPVVDRGFPLQEIAEAHRCFESGQKSSSVVIRVPRPKDHQVLKKPKVLIEGKRLDVTHAAGIHQSTSSDLSGVIFLTG